MGFMANFQIALIQMDIQIGEPDVNFKRVSELLDQAVSNHPKPDLIMLPEMWNTGYALEQITDLADLQGQRTEALFSSFCKKHKVLVVAGSVAETSEKGVRNTTYVFDRTGQRIADYSKMHLFRLMDEEKYLIAGNQLVTAELDELKSGFTICYDIRFPEMLRSLALKGVEMLFVPAEWPNPRLEHWRTLLIARAIENQMFVIACNRVGESKGTSFFGHSMVVGPWGEIIFEADDKEGIYHTSINTDQVNEVRQRIPVFEDRRPDLYL